VSQDGKRQRLGNHRHRHGEAGKDFLLVIYFLIKVEETGNGLHVSISAAKGWIKFCAKKRHLIENPAPLLLF